MGRRRSLDDPIRVRMFLEAVGDHPWACLSLIRAYSGLRAWEMDDIAQPLAEANGWIEPGRIASTGRVPPRRFALTPAGAEVITRPFSRSVVSRALLGALKLDTARQLLTEFVSQVNCELWSLSPFWVSVKDLRPSRRTSRDLPKSEVEGDYAYRTLGLDALACLKLADGAYLNVAVLTDPGGIKLEWLFHQFRSFQAWAYRPEFRLRLRVVPLLIVIAANEASRQRLIRLWQEATPWGQRPKRLRITTAQLLRQPPQARPWWNERGRPLALWADLVALERPSHKPRSHVGGWWGQAADLTAEVNERPGVARPRRNRPGVIQWANRSRLKGKAGRSPEAHWAVLILTHLRLQPHEREVLTEVGRYPLASQSELALILRRSRAALSRIFKALQACSLVEQVAWPEGNEAKLMQTLKLKRGYVLTWRGVALLAAQSGVTYPVEYARLMNWPMQEVDGKPRYSTEAWLVNAEHYRVVLAFLVGLCRSEPGQQLALHRWDHLNCRQEMPVEIKPMSGRGWRWLQSGWVIPDATGSVWAFGENTRQQVETSFWLEVDHRGARGQALWAKLQRYYRRRGIDVGGSAVSPGPRLLIVVARENEARLQALRRRLLLLNHQYDVRLDVRLTRLDLLADDNGRLHPTWKVWRTLDTSEFVDAFDRWPRPQKDKHS